MKVKEHDDLEKTVTGAVVAKPSAYEQYMLRKAHRDAEHSKQKTLEDRVLLIEEKMRSLEKILNEQNKA